MTILLTGGTGKSATPLANLLLAANQPVVLATRSGNVPAPFKGVRFDWLDPLTYGIPFESDSHIDRIYLVAPLVVDMFPPMKAFIDFAIEKGVKRFVFVSAGMLEAGGPAMGKVHGYLASLNVQYCALRPSWFFDNFIQLYADLLRTKNTLVSATGDGLVGWVSTQDIAAVAFKALVDDVIENTNPIIMGPELLSYDQIASMLTEILGRKISHTRLTEAEFKQLLIEERGMSEEFAQTLSSMDGYVAQGVDEQLFKRADVVGKRSIRAFFEANKDVWRSSE
ncbi:hypothetical protein C8R44DRAFT_832684 [Mycena epipterygia]|nr:hypothetical protein C8R44DRAFT_832684 [Mycena epipterygia]